MTERSNKESMVFKRRNDCRADWIDIKGKLFNNKNNKSPFEMNSFAILVLLMLLFFFPSPLLGNCCCDDMVRKYGVFEMDTFELA